MNSTLVLLLVAGLVFGPLISTIVFVRVRSLEREHRSRLARALGWQAPSSGLLISDGLVRQGVKAAQRSCYQVLRDWGRAFGQRVDCVEDLGRKRRWIGTAPSWAVLCPGIAEYARIFSLPDERGQAAVVEAFVSARLRDIRWLFDHGCQRIGILAFYDPFDSSDITDSPREVSALIGSANQALEPLTNESVHILRLDELFRGRASEFTHVAAGGFDPNPLGHGVIAGFIQSWVRQGVPPCDVSPDELFRQAHGL